MDVTFPASEFLDIITPLSTPIAYITTAHLRDAFGNVAYQDDPNYKGNFVYYFFNLDPNDPLVATVYRVGVAGSLEPLFAANEEYDQILTSNRYSFISVGPDKIAEFDRPGGVLPGAHAEAMTAIDGTGLYDPTNGTTSVGDITRTGKGILVDRAR